MGRLVGIDLGTTNSVVAILDGPQPRILDNKEGKTQTRSIVGLRKRRAKGGGETTELAVGDLAFDNWARSPHDTVASIKRLLGRGVADPEVERVREWAQYEIVAPSDGTTASVRVVIGGTEYSPVDVSAMILRKLKDDAEYRLGEPVTHAVITVPAYFSHVQKDATRKAGLKAGLQVIKILDEPTAAAVAYGIDSQDGTDARTLLVYDLGGGTFDISVLIMAGGNFAPLNLEGDMWLGGDNFDQALVEYAVAEIREEYGIDPTSHHEFMVELTKACQRAKETLSSADSADLIIPGRLQEAGNLIDVDLQLTRAEFEELIEPLVARTVSLVERALANAGQDADEIDAVLMAGNATMTPIVQHAMERMFGESKVLRKLHPKHCVAMGAAIVAAVIGPRVVCAAPDPSDPERECGHVNEPGAETCASCGAAFDVEEAEEPGQIHISVGGVAPFSYGAQTAGDSFTVFVRKGDTYPTDSPEMHVFRTRSPGQRMISIPIFGGDNLEQASANERQGEAFAILEPGLPADTPVRVRLWLDNNGVFRLSAHLEDGTDLAPWVVEKGEAQEKAIATLEGVERQLGQKADAATPDELRESEQVRERVFSEMRAGRFERALEEARNLERIAGEVGVADERETNRRKAEGLINFSTFVLEQYVWAFPPMRAEEIARLVEKTKSALQANDAPMLETSVRELDKATDDLPEIVTALLGLRGAIASRVYPFDPAAAQALAAELADAEEACRSDGLVAVQKLNALGQHTLAVIAAIPPPPEVYRCSRNHLIPQGERYCPECGEDSWTLKV